jgi:hypothetical protein
MTPFRKLDDMNAAPFTLNNSGSSWASFFGIITTPILGYVVRQSFLIFRRNSVS